MDTDMYRITRTAPKGRPNVRYGTKRRASAIAGQVKRDNQNYIEGVAWYRSKGVEIETVPRVELLIERAPVGEFTDVTAEFMED